MIHYDDAGTVVYLLLVIPLLPPLHSSFFTPRWAIRMVLTLRLILGLYRYLFINRASPHSSLFIISLLTGLITLFCTAALAEFQRKNVALKEYHDQFGAILILGLGLVFLTRQTLKSCVCIPGPFIARHTFFWKIWHLFRGTYDQAVLEAHRKYGSIIRVSPYEYSISDFGCANLLPPARFIGAQVFTGTCIELLLSFPERLPYLSRDDLIMSQAISHEPVIDSCTDVLLARLTEYADRREPVQLSRLVTCYVWGVMSATTVGDRFGFQDSKSASTVADRLGDFKLKAVLRGSFFRFYPCITRIIERMTFQENVAVSINGLLDRIIDERLGYGSEQQDADHEAAAEKLLNSCIEKSAYLRDFLKSDSPMNKVSSMGKLHIILALFLVTADPTAVHLLTTFVYLGTHPGARDRIRQEAKSFKDDPCLDDLTHLERDLPFLDAVLHESTRLMASIGCMFTRYSMDGPVTMKDHRIPQECTIRLSAHAAGRDKNIFGEDADIWKPERWLGDEKPPSLAFGQSSFSDINTIARAIVSKTVLRVIKSFDFGTKMSTTESTVMFMTGKDLNNVFLMFQPIKGSFSKHVPFITGPIGSLTIVTEDSEDVKFFCSMFGKAEQSVILGLLKAQDFNKELAAFTSLQTKPITDRRQRARFHQLNRTFFHGQLDSNTERANSAITLFRKGSSKDKYHNSSVRSSAGNSSKPGHNNSRLSPKPSSNHVAATSSAVGIAPSNLPNGRTNNSQTRMNAKASTFKPSTQSSPSTKRILNPIWGNFIEKEVERKTSPSTDVNTSPQPEPKPFKLSQTFKRTDRNNGEKVIERSSVLVNDTGVSPRDGQAASTKAEVKTDQESKPSTNEHDSASWLIFRDQQTKSQPPVATEPTNTVESTESTEPVLKWKETYKITKPEKRGNWLESSSRNIETTSVTTKSNDGVKIESGPTFKATFIKRKGSSESMKSDKGKKKDKSVGPHRTVAGPHRTAAAPHKRVPGPHTKL